MFQKYGKAITDIILRQKVNNRDYNIKDFEDMEVKIRRGDASIMIVSGLLRSESVINRLVQNRGARIQVVCSDVKALYPSLEAVEVAEIVYTAVMEIKVKFKNID